MNFLSRKNQKVLKIASCTIAVIVFLTVASAVGYAKSQPLKAIAVSVSTSATSTKAGSASLYPNPKLTPGAVFPVNAKTVCVSGYTATVRDVTLSTKKKVYAEYGVPYPQPTGAYEVDHFIPLEIGGSNDIKNLWLEPASPTPGFHQKDVYENYEHKQVCSGQITLQEAQNRMASDWYKYYLIETGKTPVTATSSQSATATAIISTPVAPQSITPATISPTPVAVPVSSSDQSPAVKKSSTGLCHAKGTQYYNKTTNFVVYNSINACLASGGRLPK